jgi:hypothetical protein
VVGGGGCFGVDVDEALMFVELSERRAPGELGSVSQQTEKPIGR